MKLYQPHLDWIASQQREMLRMVLAWAEINSGSYNREGLAAMAHAIEQEFAVLEPDSVEWLDLMPIQSVSSDGGLTDIPLGQALRLRKRPQAPLQVMLTGHMDTVFPREHGFQHCTLRDDDTVNGPGVADMKGGIVVMLHALQALEQSPWKEHIGWEALINPDEEIGSIGSAPLLVEGAKRNHFGLTYEPSLPDGTLAGTRKGSGNFTAVVRGRAAHAGRDPQAGRNAIALLAEFILAIFELNGKMPGVTVNPGKLEGGGPVNVVPDLAICRFNVRVATPEEQVFVENELTALEDRLNQRDGFQMKIHGGFTRPPKILSPANLRLLELVKDCGVALGMSLHEKPTGGCCDGNNLAAAGLPNIDTLGVRGANIHSSEEYMIIPSLAERAQLSALLLLRLASKEVAWG